MPQRRRMMMTTVISLFVIIRRQMPFISLPARSKEALIPPSYNTHTDRRNEEQMIGGEEEECVETNTFVRALNDTTLTIKLDKSFACDGNGIFSHALGIGNDGGLVVQP